MSKSDNITLMILTPQATLFEGLVEKVELPGVKGRFMILKDHAPIISSLEEGDVIFESDGVTEKVNIMSGFVEVNNNVVTVCAEL
jgi:F-type H+-transporting ATPase subunit epsilon